MKEGLVHSVKLAGDVAVPRSLRALLAARMTRLEPEYRAMLCATAILGEQVDITVLAVMLAVTLQASDRTIAALEKRSLLRRTGPSSVALASPMLRESLLESLPTETKLELHAAAVSAYETVYGASIENHAHHVAQHLREVGDRDRAAQFYALSGRQRLRSGQLEAAVRDMQYALDLVDVSRRSAEELCDWLEDIHTAVRAVRTGTALPNVIGRVLSRIDCDGHPGFCVQARTIVAGILGAIHQFDLADEYAMEAIELAFPATNRRQDIRKWGTSLSITYVGELLERNGIKLLKCGSLPAKADPSAQRKFFEETLQPLMERPRNKEVSLLFVDASHFVMGCDFLGKDTMCSMH